MFPTLKLQVYRIGLLLFFYQFIRVIFFIFNYSLFSQNSFNDLFTAFIIGVRYDLSAVSLTYIPFFVFSLIPKLNQIVIWRKAENFIFISANAIFLALNMADIEYTNFVGRRLTYDVFKIQQDIQNAALGILQYYWLLFTITLVVVGIFIYTSQKIYTKNLNNRKDIKKTRIAYSVLYSVLIFILLIISSRGGLQLKPLKTTHAALWVKPDLLQLSTNSTFTILKNLKQDDLPLHTFFQDEADVLIHIHTYNDNINHRFYNPANRFRPKAPIKNIIIIIMESFSLEYIGRVNNGVGYTPFLDQLIDKSLFFKESFANGRRSIEALPSILCGLPSLMKEAFITSKYSENRIHCLPEILKQNGFETLFFHGAENGSMFFDSFSKKVGFNNYFGLSEYPETNHKDGTWGVYDEPFFQFAAKNIQNLSSRHLSVLFSLSSHHPYSVPHNFANKFPKGTLEIHESIGYADYALSQFFKTMENDKNFHETLFVITADHTQKSDQPYYKDFLGNYRVPILFFFPPGWETPELYITNYTLQHIDIFPTVLDLALPSLQPHSFMGKSINSNTNGQAFNFSDEYFWLLREGKLVKTNNTQSFDYYSYDHKTGSLDKESSQNNENLASSLRAILQFYSHGLKKNKL